MSFFKKNQVRFDGTKEIETREKNQTNNVISRRFKILMIGVTIIGIVLLLRLYITQIKQEDYYTNKLIQYNSDTFTSDTFRGNIYDRHYERLSYNKNINVASYYAVKGIQNVEIDMIVNFLIDHVNVDTKSVTLRDKKDFLIKKDEKYVNSLFDKNLMKETGKTLYQLQLEYLTKEIVDKKLSERDLKYYMLYFKIQNCRVGSVVLLEGLSIKEASLIGENANLLRGVKVTNDWSREKTYGSNFSSVIGKVTTKKEGLPLSSRDLLLAKDYSNNSRVGVSGIEQQYESVLSGTGAKYSLSYDSKGNPIVQSITDGKKGLNVRLSIDWEIQQILNDAIEQEIRAHSAYEERHANNIFLVMMDPNNGEIIAMCGKQRMENGEIVDYASGTYFSAYEIGSAFKGATVYTGFKYDVLNKNTYFVDKPWKIKGTNPKASWNKNGLGRINEVQALSLSSNIYMFETITRLAKGEYKYDQPLVIDPKAFDTLRLSAGELGLGVKTGLDVPYESLGYRGRVTNRLAGNLLDASIGQYDTYTPIQMAQYVSTIANGGKRIQPHLFLDAFDENAEGERISILAHKVKVLDDVSSYKLAFERIQTGFRTGCVTGLARNTNGYYQAAGKTGTAEVYGKTVSNRSYIGYAPFDKPQIAIAIMCEAQAHSPSNQRLAKLAFETYFNKYGVKNK